MLGGERLFEQSNYSYLIVIEDRKRWQLVLAKWLVKWLSVARYMQIFPFENIAKSEKGTKFGTQS